MARIPFIRVTAMPSDTNPYGGVFGGWLMSQMALAAGSLASRTARGKCVVVAADELRFPGAMAVGDELSVYAELTGQGRTSLKIADRVLGESVTCGRGLTGVLLDPPYSDLAGRDPDIYICDSRTVAHEVREWAIDNGANKNLRIALCGYEGEHDHPK